MFFLLFYHLCNCVGLDVLCPAVAASLWHAMLPGLAMVNFFHCAVTAFLYRNQHSFAV